jgi:acetylornithine deacetylase/succinyl-diaminopimelate desuccinylase-like protein
MFSSTDPLVERAAQRALAMLMDAVPIASISAQQTGLEEGAQHFSTLLDEAGFRTTRWEGRGAPVVFAEIPAPPGRPTLLFYGHYDVQPPDPVDAWTSPPFEATLRDGAVFGRGAGDNKGQLLAHVAAVAELAAAGKLDCGVKFLIEGEEEIGSPNIGAVARDHRAALAADLAITADAPVHDDGRPVVIFGVRGLLYVELRAQGAARDLHSGNRGGIAPAPASDMVRLLGSLQDAKGEILIPGFYDQVRPPTERELAMTDSLPVDHAALRAELGEAADRWREESPWRRLMFRPNCNIAGISTGYGGEGTKTVIPCEARAKIDFRLVADQEPEAIFAALADHAAAVAPSVQLRCTAAVPPSATDPETPFAAVVIEAVSAATGSRPLLRPRLGGTTPDYVFTRILRIPSLLVPYGPPDMNHHAPDEKMTLEALQRGVACSVELCRRLAQETPAR